MVGATAEKGGPFSCAARRSVVLRLAEQAGGKMNIDLDSWEAGYADGQHGRPPQCAIGLDQVSYLSGFCHGRARRAQSRTKSSMTADSQASSVGPSRCCSGLPAPHLSQCTWFT